MSHVYGDPESVVRVPIGGIYNRYYTIFSTRIILHNDEFNDNALLNVYVEGHDARKFISE